MCEKAKDFKTPEQDNKEFGELLKYTFSGYGIGLFLATLLDYFSFQRSAVGQWLVRTVSGESESLFEGIYAIRQRLIRASGSLAEAYSWGKLMGIVIPWIIDFGSRIFGIDVYGVEAFYIPYFYALSDQIGANVSGIIYLRRQGGTWLAGVKRYFSHPVMITSLLIILIVPIGLLLARILGFSPKTQIYTALETISANICWLPPLVGWLMEKRRNKESTHHL